MELKDHMERVITGVTRRMLGLSQDIQNLQQTVRAYKTAISHNKEKLENVKIRKRDRRVNCKQHDDQYTYYNRDISKQIGICISALYVMEDKKELITAYHKRQKNRRVSDIKLDHEHGKNEQNSGAAGATEEEKPFYHVDRSEHKQRI